jgi:hypothetical protein
LKKSEKYQQELVNLEDWEPYLLAESGLPGPRANLELVQVVADMGDRSLFDRLLPNSPIEAPTNTAREFLALCGVVGLGKLLAAGGTRELERLRFYANDPRWRMREGVCMALQRYGQQDMGRLINEMERWSTGTLLERRAAACALCHPELLNELVFAERTLNLLDEITGSIIEYEDRRSEAFKALRKGLGYCWSVAIAASPQIGKPIFEAWLTNHDKDIRWIMKGNLRKARMKRMDAEWVERCWEVMNK